MVQLPAGRSEETRSVFRLRGSVGEGGRASGLGGGSSARGSGVVGMSVEPSHRAFSTPPRGGPVTRGAGEFMGEETGRGDRARVRHNTDNNGDNRVQNLPIVFANVRVSGQGGHCPV